MTRDVELVIRARDAATKAIDSIKDALQELTSVQEDVGKSAAKTDTLLGDLGRQLSTLNAEAKGLTSLSKVAGEIEKAGGAVSKLEGDVAKSAAEFAKLARETESATRNADRLRGQLEAERKALNESTSARKAASEQLREANKQVTQAEANQRAYNRALEKVPVVKPTKGVGQEAGAAFSSARESYGVFATAELTTARNAQAQLKGVVADFTAEVDKSKQAISVFETQVGSAAEQERRLSKETEKVSNSLSKSRTDLAQGRTALAEIKTAADTASTSFNGMALNQDRVAQASARMAAEIARTKARIDGISQSQKTADPATGDRRAVLEARREFVATQAEVKRLAQELRSASTPTAELGAALGKAQAAARAASEAYEANRAAAARLKNEQGSLATFLQRTATEQQKSANSFVSAQAQMARGGTTITTMAAATAASLPPIAAAAQEVDRGLTQVARGGTSFRDVMRSLGSDVRSSSGMLESLRGELLSVTAGFIGLYGAANQVGQVLKAFQTLEGAQARLSVVFNGDQTKVGKELDFISREAQRLGVEFGILSDQYSKFAVAAQAANFTSEATRKVFLSVAEAGRVNRLSADQLNGVFLALTQMISKGKVSAEELRGQLGERLTGAFNIFADAIGVTTAELDDMLKKGEVIASQGTLLKFATELDKRFGPALAAAIAGTTAEMGRFADNVFQAQVRVAEGGFIDGFTKALQNLNAYFQSRDGRDFFLSLGAALGTFATAISKVPQYFSEIGTAITVIIGLKLGSYFSSVITAVRGMQGAFATASAGLFSWQGNVTALNGQLRLLGGGVTSVVNGVANFASGAVAANGSVSVLRGGLLTLRGVAVAAAGSFRLLWAAIGGIPGIVLTGVTIAIGQWITQTDQATSALDEHKRQMQEVIAAYEQAKGKAVDWGNAVKGVTVSQAQDSLLKLMDAYDAKIADLNKKAQGARSQLEFLSGPLGEIRRQGMNPALLGDIEKLVGSLDKLKSKSISLEEFKQALNEIARTTANTGLKALAVDLQNYLTTQDESGTSFADLSDAIEKSEARLRLLKGEATDADKSLLGLTDSTKDAGTALDKAGKEDAKAFSDALKEIRKEIPGIGDELKRLGDIDALDKQYQQAVKLARTMSEVNELTKAYNSAVDAVNIKSFGGTGMEASVNLLKESEGFRPTPYWDVNAYRVGYGSDTITLADGSIKKVVQGIAITEADALRDLVRRIGEFQDVVKDQIGADRFNGFTPDQKASLTSVAYNYGRLPAELAKVIKTGSSKEIADAIRARGGDNDGVNRGRRNKEAALFEGGGDTVKSQQEVAAVEEKRAAKAKEYNADLETRLALQENENANGGRLNRDGAIQKALAEERNRAEEAGVTLTAERIAQITELAGKEYDLANAKREGKTADQEANTALQQATALAAQRNELQRQFNLATKTGDLTTATELQTQLDSTNLKLQEAIDKARAMWQAIGGPEADVALTKLDTLSLKAQTSANSMSFLGLSTQQVGQLAQGAADGLLSVFDSFAQAIANGENAVKALGQAFLQFAANFLREIATMIIKAQLFAAVQGIGKALGISIPTAHTGGVIGSVGAGLGNGHRSAAPALFAGYVARYHTGGIAGLRPDEVPAVLKQGEEVLTENDPRHRANGGLGGAAPAPSQTIRNILVMDEESALNHLNSSAGEQVVFGHVRRNAATIKRIIG